MVKKSIIIAVNKYLETVRNNGIKVSFGVIFGSQLKGNTDKWSDIDLIVVSPGFDKRKQRKDISLLWRLTIQSDNRIEPIAVGKNEWETDDTRPVIEIARREGVVVTPEPAAHSK